MLLEYVTQWVPAALFMVGAWHKCYGSEDNSLMWLGAGLFAILGRSFLSLFPVMKPWELYGTSTLYAATLIALLVAVSDINKTLGPHVAFGACLGVTASLVFINAWIVMRTRQTPRTKTHEFL